MSRFAWIPVLRKTLSSPDFVKSAYSTGFGQFGDAVQRAEFYNVMKENCAYDSQCASAVALCDDRRAFGQSRSPASRWDILAALNGDFFNSHLSTLLQAEGFEADRLPLFLSNNVFLYLAIRLAAVCWASILAFDASTPGHPAVQTFAWASWTSEGIFSSFSDVTPLSHEISEWRNDPFVNNLAPAWQFPNGRGCEGNLETGDPIKVLSNVDRAGHPQRLHLPSANGGATPVVHAGGSVRGV